MWSAEPLLDERRIASSSYMDDASSSNHVATLVLAPSVPTGTTVATPSNDYSLLRTTEELLGNSAYLRNAATAARMRSSFHL
jgi:hypothetical protein